MKRFLNELEAVLVEFGGNRAAGAVGVLRLLGGHKPWPDWHKVGVELSYLSTTKMWRIKGRYNGRFHSVIGEDEREHYKGPFVDLIREKLMNLVPRGMRARFSVAHLMVENHPESELMQNLLGLEIEIDRTGDGEYPGVPELFAGAWAINKQEEVEKRKELTVDFAEQEFQLYADFADDDA